MADAVALIESAYMAVRKPVKRQKAELEARNAEMPGSVRLIARAVSVRATYTAGRRLDPNDAEIEVSRAVTAELCATCLDGRLEVRQRMIAAGREAAERAIELRPRDAGAYHVLGMFDYSFRHGSIESALRCFEAAVAIDPSSGWARLYRAHCLHDLGRWPEAVQAYSEVNPAFFIGPIAWRYDLLREQRAWCLLQAGHRDDAVREFLAILHRYELQPNLARYQMLKELGAAAEGPLHLELSARLDALRNAVDGLSVAGELEGS